MLCCSHLLRVPTCQVYYKEAVGAIVVYDVNRAPTFEAVKKWKNDIDNKVMIPTGMIPTILLANKCDLLKDPVDKAELMKFCADNDFKGW
jgi:Ras-related protein Rab-32|eukprot:COSAG06_NODE_7226_length_2579_cov_12.281452_1_plen_90_part_00